MVTIVTRAGKGSELTHNEVDANFTNLNDVVSIAARKYTTTIGNATDTTFTITHNLGTKDIAVLFRANNPVNGFDFNRFRDQGTDQYTFDIDTELYSISIVEQFTSRTDNAVVVFAEFIDLTGDVPPITNILPTGAVTATIIG